MNYNQEEADASCFTHDRQLIRKLDDLSQISPAVVEVRGGEGWKEYKFPKKWIKIKMPRQISEEQRKALSERAKLNFVTAKSGEEKA